MLNEYTVLPMSDALAHRISKWGYPEPYSVYSMKDEPAVIAELCNNDYYAVLDHHGNLAGYFCFGLSARIPAVEDSAYSDKALDIGLGMKPGLCGQGLGNEFLNCGIAFAIENLLGDNTALRLTVAEFNQRAIKVYEKAGFAYSNTIEHRISGAKFHIMLHTVKSCGVPPAAQGCFL